MSNGSSKYQFSGYGDPQTGKSGIPPMPHQLVSKGDINEEIKKMANPSFIIIYNFYSIIQLLYGE